jgi:hypothetical protein
MNRSVLQSEEYSTDDEEKPKGDDSPKAQDEAKPGSDAGTSFFLLYRSSF